MTIQVNVVNTFLLALLLLPKLRETKKLFPEATPHLEIVSSEAHHLTTFPQISAQNIYQRLNDPEAFEGRGRYAVSKLMEVLFIRELVARLSTTSTTEPPSPDVIITMVNPGLCYSEISRNQTFINRMFFLGFRALFARSTEVGARTLVYGACAGPESHGEFMSDGVNQDVERWIYEDVGRRAQRKVFEQTMRVLEERSPGNGKVVGL